MKPEKLPAQYYLKYAGLAFQIFGTLAIGAWLGQWLDKKLQLPNPYITITLVLFLFIGIMYRIILDVNRKSE